MFFKLRTVIFFFILLNLVVLTGNNVEAQIKDYGKALTEILKVKPDTIYIEKAEEIIEEPEEPDMKSFNMKLKDCIILAIHNNYDIKIAKLEPMITENDITVARSVFDPVFIASGETAKNETPSNSGVLLGATTGGDPGRYKQDTNTIDASLEKLFSTGTIFTLEFNIERANVDPVSAFTLKNPVTEGYIEAKITQPLLRNAGIFYNKSEIYIARNNKEKSVLELKEATIDVINSVQTAYWELVKTVEELRVRKKSLESAEDLLRKNKIQAKVGTLAPIEVLVAEDGVANKMNDIIETENNIKNREDDLKLIMNLSNHSSFSDVAIIPSDQASFTITDVTLDESIKNALANRPELFKQSLDIANARITVKQKRNELLPTLDAEAGIRYNGLSNTYGNAADSIFSEDFQSQFFGLALEVPIGNREARSNYSMAKLDARQSVLSKKRLEQEIIVEVRTAVREIKKNAESIKATEKARELALERLEAEEKKFKVGRSTSLEVLRAQDNLTIAEGKAVNALVNYQISIGDLDAKMGTILENNNIIIEDDDFVVKSRKLTSGEFHNN
ncbi:MAG: TolC family protein [Candidatus Scalindua sp.]|nr:TolC family protein [Candidatus Scalindua sp.]